MIEERFLIAAVNIRKKYISMMSDLDKYHNKAKDTLEVINVAYNKLENLEKDIEKKKNDENFSSVDSLLAIMNEIESEGKRLEKFTNPINKEIEKLGIEEAELWKQICEKHSDMEESDIIKIVSERLKKEGLV